MMEIVPYIIVFVLGIFAVIFCVALLFFDKMPYSICMLSISFVIYLICCCGFSLKEKLANQNTFSKDCYHQWVEIETSSNGAVHSIYCPACKTEKEVDEKEWKRMQVDMEYQERQEEEY